MIKLGVISSTPDERDYGIQKLVPKLNTFPASYIVPYSWENLNIIENQGNISCCVGESLCYIKEVQENKESSTFKQFSPMFVYANRSPEDYQGEGMMPREALKHLKESGICERKYLPDLIEVPQVYDVFKEKMTPELLEEAKKYKISAYARLYSVADIKSALMQLGAVTFAIEVYDNFFYVGEDGIVPPPMGAVQGGHEMTIIGWDDEKHAWLVANSWGNRWGNRGYCWYNYDYPISEAWSLTDSVEVNHNEDGKFYRVYIDKYFFKSSALKKLDKIKKLIKDVKPVLVKRGIQYSIQIGAFPTQDKAKALHAELLKLKEKPYIIYE